HNELLRDLEGSPPVLGRIVRIGLIHLPRALTGSLADDRVEPRRHRRTAARPHLARDKGRSEHRPACRRVPTTEAPYAPPRDNYFVTAVAMRAGQRRPARKLQLRLGAA